MGETKRRVRIQRAVDCYVNLVSARELYEEAMLKAAKDGVTFSDLSRALGITEPAVRGFVRRAQRRRSKHE